MSSVITSSTPKPTPAPKVATVNVPTRAVKHPWFALGLLALPMALWAQGATAPTDPAADWKRANNAVAEFPRGHADVLKWEQANTPTTANANPMANANLLPIPDLAQATRLAWAAHRELAGVQSRAGAATVDLVVQGQWSLLEPRLQRRVKGFDELLEVAALGRKAWLQAVAAQQTLKHQRDMLDATEAALELGQRMVAVGNWSKLQLTQVQLAKTSAHMNWKRGQYAAAQAQGALLKTLRLNGMVKGLALPSALPALPANPLTEADLALRLQALQAHMPLADGQRQQALAQLAFEAQQASRAVAQGSQNEVLATRQLVVQETQLHYNGMLKSVWDLLTEVNNQSQAAIDAINAQRDALVADTDLNWVLQGGTPDGLVVLGGGAATTPAAGH